MLFAHGNKHSEMNPITGKTGIHTLLPIGASIISANNAEEFIEGDNPTKEAVWSQTPSQEKSQEMYDKQMKAKYGMKKVPKYQSGNSSVNNDQQYHGLDYYGAGLDQETYPGLAEMGYGHLIKNPSLAQQTFEYGLTNPNSPAARKAYFNQYENTFPEVKAYVQDPQASGYPAGSSLGKGISDQAANYGPITHGTLSRVPEYKKAMDDPFPNFYDPTGGTPQGTMLDEVVVKGTLDDIYPNLGTPGQYKNYKGTEFFEQDPNAGAMEDPNLLNTRTNIQNPDATGDAGEEQQRMGWSTMPQAPKLGIDRPHIPWSAMYNIGRGMAGIDDLDLGRYNPRLRQFQDTGERDRADIRAQRAIGQRNLRHMSTGQQTGYQQALAQQSRKAMGDVNVGQIRDWNKIAQENIGLQNQADRINLGFQQQETMYDKQARAAREKYLGTGIKQYDAYRDVDRREKYAKGKDALADYRQQQALGVTAFGYGLGMDDMNKLGLGYGGYNPGYTNNYSFGPGARYNTPQRSSTNLTNPNNPSYREQHGESRFGKAQRGAREGIKAGYGATKDFVSDAYDATGDMVERKARRHRYRNPNAEQRYYDRQDARRERQARRGDKEYERLTGEEYVPTFALGGTILPPEEGGDKTSRIDKKMQKSEERAAKAEAKFNAIYNTLAPPVQTVPVDSTTVANLPMEAMQIDESTIPEYNENSSLLAPPSEEQVVEQEKIINNPLYYANKYLGVNETNPEQQKTIQGFLNKAVGKDWVKSSSEVSRNDRAWCGAFVDGVLRDGGFNPLSSEGSWNSIRAKEYSNLGTKVDGISKASPGDIVVLKNKKTGSHHVGFYSGKTGDKFTLLGGNQGTVKNPKSGLEVNVKNIDLDKDDIIAVRRIKGIEAMPEERLASLYQGDYYVPTSEGTR
jgi:uncharacterized protein (TIGR02594 family)